MSNIILTLKIGGKGLLRTSGWRIIGRVAGEKLLKKESLKKGLLTVY